MLANLGGLVGCPQKLPDKKKIQDNLVYHGCTTHTLRTPEGPGLSFRRRTSEQAEKVSAEERRPRESRSESAVGTEDDTRLIISARLGCPSLNPRSKPNEAFVAAVDLLSEC